jgi:hypothetical protein
MQRLLRPQQALFPVLWNEETEEYDDEAEILSTERILTLT